jgi:hypothetical protein
MAVAEEGRKRHKKGLAVVIPITRKNLHKMGFDPCIIGGRPCPGATQFVNGKPIKVCCSERYENVTIAQAANCRERRRMGGK